MQKEKKLDKLLIGVSLVVVFAIVACLAIAPTGSQRVANSVKSFLIDRFRLRHADLYACWRSAVGRHRL